MKAIIKNISRCTLLLTVLFFSLGLNTAKASHYAGADLFLDMISSDSTVLKYRVSLIVYKACEVGSIDLNTRETVYWSSASANFNGNRSFLGTPFDTLDQLCANFSATNSCRVPGSLYPGFVRCHYIDTVTLPSRQKDWKFWWSNGSRNQFIENLGLTPGSSQNFNIYIEVGMNNTGSYWKNSTPRYLTDPVPYLCVNQPQAFLNGAFDPDLDSMVTAAVVPLSAANTPIPWRPTAVPGVFSLANPINSTAGNPYSVNPSTATAYFTPQQTGKFVLAFQTNSFSPLKNASGRNDSISYIRRDVQVSVLSCAAPAPSLDTFIVPTGGLPLANRYISICPNTTTSFTISARSQSGLNSIVLSTDPQGTTATGFNFNVVYSSGSAVGTFTWTPTTADIGTYVVTFKAVDTTCDPSQPILLRSSAVVTIRVLPGLDVGPDRKICPLGDYPIVLTTNGLPTTVFNWSKLGGPPSSAEFIDCVNCPTVTVRPPYDYTYVVSTTDPYFACKNKDTVKITVDYANGIEATQDPLIVCRPGYVTLTSQALGLPPVSNLTCGIINPQICPVPDQVVVGGTTNVASDPINTPFYSANNYHKYQFIIKKEDLRNAGLYSGTLSNIAFLSANSTVSPNGLSNVRISLKCTRNSRYAITPGNGDFETGTTLVATVPTMTLTPNSWNSIPFDKPYNWDTSQNLLVDICVGPLATTNAPGVDAVAMSPGSTIQRSSNTVDVCSGNVTTVRGYAQRPTVRFDYCQAPNLPFTYAWGPGNYLSDSTLQNPVAYVPSSGRYTVYTRGRNGCLVSDSLRITVPIHTLDISPNDTSLCVGQPGRLHARGASGGYIWYENGFNTPTTLSCNTCPDPIVIPQVAGDYVYTVVFLDTSNCFDTLTATVHAYPLPGVHITSNDTTIKYGQSVMLTVTGASQYSWTPVGSLSDPNSPNPIATPTETTDYIVFALSDHQCRNSDTVRVTVDFRDNLLVPSGFTPNNDGKNDVFKIVNVTFQKLMEFRVFNRWGQEVFSTNDPMRGWDGKWKGVEQDMGNYTYIIRVAYPDGFVETYKGDVTLIR